jgi:RND family efflux transporter MFP subunit
MMEYGKERKAATQERSGLVKSASLGRLAMAAMLAAGLMVLAGCTNTAPATGASSAPPSVTVSKPAVREVTDYFEFPGWTQAVSEVLIRARVTGYIKRVNFEDGQEVKKGQALFEIDPRPYKAILDRAKGDLARLEAMREKAQTDLSRSNRLRPSGAVSQDEYEQHVAQLKTVTAMIASAKAAVTEAELNLEFTKIISPIDGRVSSARIREGNLVQTGSDSPVLTTVVTINPIYVCFEVDEHALLKYEALAKQAGQALHPSRLKNLKSPVEIGLADEEGFPHAGTIDFADNKIDRGTGTLRVRGVFENTKEYLTPGLFVRVRLPFGKPHQALLVSERAINRDQRQKYLLTVNKEHKVEYRQVKVGPLRDGLRVIESGIGPDDLVIVSGLQRVFRPGAVVSPHPPEEQGMASSPAGAQMESKKTGAPATTN